MNDDRERTMAERMDMGENALGGGAREAVFNLAVVPGCGQ